MPKVSIIIVNYNGAEWLTRSALSVAAQSEADFECFIIDNGSADGSIAVLPKLDDRFEIIELGENTGFAKANNIGAKRASAPWIACLNPDAFAREDWLEKLLVETARGPHVTMVGSTQFMALEDGVYDGAGDCYHVTGLAWRSNFGHKISESAPLKTCEVFAPCAAASLYHRETFLRLGGFDERYFCYHEDVDLGFRMRLDGGICVQSALAIVDHVSSGISGRASEFAVYHGTRNRMWTFVKCMPALGLWLFLPAHIFLNLALLFWAIFRPGRFKPTARGVRDGLKGLGPIWKSRKAIHGPRRIGLFKLLGSIAFNPFAVLSRDQVSLPLDS
jgi:GT2 family glycosyltransferase